MGHLSGAATLTVFDFFLWYSGILLQTVVLVIVIRKSVHRRIPSLAFYLAGGTITDLIGLYVIRVAPAHFLGFTDLNACTDAVFEFALLIDLARLAAKGFPRTVRRSGMFVLVTFLVLSGAIIWWLSGLWTVSNVPPAWQFALQLQSTISVLRIIFLAGIAGLSQFLNEHFGPLGWGDRELQVATGLVAYSLAAMIGTLLHTYSIPRWLFHDADMLAPVTYWCVLVYWIFSFLRPERNKVQEGAHPERDPDQVAGDCGKREDLHNSGTLAGA